jgi:hypothetical protein
MGSPEGDNPEADDERPDGEDPFTDGAVVRGEGGGLADAEDLAAEADGHEDNADGEGKPGQVHGISFYPNKHRCGKREAGPGGQGRLRE